MNTLIGFILCAVIFVPQIIWLYIGYENVTSVQEAFYAICIALIVGFAYFYRDNNFLFRALHWISKNLMVPNHEIMLLLFSGAFLLIGVYKLI